MIMNIAVDRVVGNAHLLLSTKNPEALPYQHPNDGTKFFFVTNLPDSLKPQKKHGANDKFPCHFCREEVKISQCETMLGVIYCAVFVVLVMLKLKHIGSGERDQLHRDKTQATQMNCNRLEKIPVGFVAWMAALQIYWRRNQEIQSSSLSHQIALIIMNACSIKMQQFLPTICHAPMSQYIVPFAPHHSQGTHRQYGNIMLCII
jgi:hypothetical protein